jgi:hypothetical protein
MTAHKYDEEDGQGLTELGIDDDPGVRASRCKNSGVEPP